MTLKATSKPVEPAIPGDDWGGQFRFEANGIDYFSHKLLHFLLGGVTCNLSRALGFTSWDTTRWITDRIAWRGQRFRFTATWGDILGNHILTGLLTFATCGVGLPWAIVMHEKYVIERTITNDGRRLRFDGRGLDLVGLILLTIALVPLTLGLAFPWLAVQWRGWFVSHTLIEDPTAPEGYTRLRFDGTATSFAVQAILSVLLVYMTCGLYLPWAVINYLRWSWRSTADEREPRIAVPVGPQSPGQKAALVIAAVGGFGVVGTALLLVTWAGISLPPRIDPRPSFPRLGLSPQRSQSLQTSPTSPKPKTIHQPTAPLRPSQPPEAAPPPRNITQEAVLHVRASSEQANHSASHAFDELPKTAWNENDAGDGTGQWIEAQLRPETYLTSIKVGCGWSALTAHGEDLWELNNSFRKMQISWDGGSAIVECNRATDRGVKKSVPIRTTTRFLRITALEVDRGRFNDLCLDDVLLFGGINNNPPNSQ